MLNLFNRLKGFFTMPTAAREDLEEDGGGFVWDQSARIMLAIVLVVVSAFVMYWIMA